MKILHIVPGETSYMYSFLKMMSWTENWEDEHIYYAMLSHENVIRKFPKLLAQRGLIYLEDNGWGIDKKLKKLFRLADKIIWHSFVKIPIRYKRYLNKHSDIIYKSYWCMNTVEIEYLQKKEIAPNENVDYWLDTFLENLKIICPIDLYRGLIEKYTPNVMEGEYPYPYCYNHMVEPILINRLAQQRVKGSLVQIGFSAGIANEHGVILKAFVSKESLAEQKYCIPMRYANYSIGSQIDVENIQKLAEYLREQNCEVIIMDNVVSSYNYLLYLNQIKEVHIGEIPATAIDTLVYLGYLDKEIYYYGKNEKLKNFAFYEWAKKELDIEYNRAQWRKLFAMMRE